MISKLLFFICFTCIIMIGGTATAADPLPADQAFRLSLSTKDPQTLLATWNIAPGYYLYQDKIRFKAVDPQQIKLGQPLMPMNNQHRHYPGIGTLKTYSGRLAIAIPILSHNTSPVNIEVQYQGCSAYGFCYPPIKKVLTVSLKTTSEQTIIEPPHNKYTALLKNHNVFVVILSFFGFGILISFTPCVLPMIPILSGIIIGQKKISHARSFGLSLAYVLGMAITYALAGVLFGLIGSSVQALFQQPWIIIVFSLIFVAMALSLFGFYNLELPEALRSRVAALSNHQKHTYIGTAIMGCLSTLILSPCVTPALVSALGYISQSGNALFGGITLFAMGIGMGIPLLIIGASSAKLLPKAGPWMNSIKNFLGLGMLALAVWMISRIIPAHTTLLLWSALAIGSAVGMGVFTSSTTHWQLFKKGIGLILFIYGIILIIGATAGSTSLLAPLNLTHTQATTSKTTNISFTPIKSFQDLKQQLQTTQSSQQPVLLDFYADWCNECKVMDAFTFTDPKVQQLMRSFKLLRANVTANDSRDQLLERKLNVVAPPTILFFDRKGQELTQLRLVGGISADRFAKHLTLVLQHLENQP